MAPKRGYKWSKPSVLVAFVEDLKDIHDTAGYTRKDDYAQRMSLTRAAFDRRICRARKIGLLEPSVRNGCTEFRPFNTPCNCERY